MCDSVYDFSHSVMPLPFIEVFIVIPFVDCRLLDVFDSLLLTLPGSIPEEWTNQEENQDNIAPLAEVQQKLKLRHARTVRTDKGTSLFCGKFFCLRILFLSPTSALLLVLKPLMRSQQISFIIVFIIFHFALHHISTLFLTFLPPFSDLFLLYRNYLLTKD